MFFNNAKNKQGFFLFDFFLVLISCIVLSVFPDLGWIPLAIAILPFVIWLIAKRSSRKITCINFLIAFFLISSFVGILVAYNPNQAVQKFRLIIGSILLFFAISRQKKENLWIITTSFGIFGILTTAIFVLVNNWANFPADIQFVNNLGDLLGLQSDGKIEAFLNDQLFHANIVAGIIAILFPLNAVTTLHFWTYRRNYLFVFSLAILAFLGLGLILTSSRAAWVATFVGLVIFASIHNPNIRSFLITHKFIFLLIPVVIITFGLIGPILLADTINKLPLSISEVTSFQSRVQLARQTFFLITDFPFTGGGLGSFPGNYSQYILAIPFFMFSNSHNLYLDLTFEQGIFGLIIWLLIICLCVETIISVIIQEQYNGDSSFWASAVFASLATFLLHGIIDDPIYGNDLGILLLFIFPGLSIAISEPREQVIQRLRTVAVTSLAILVVLILSFFIYQKQIRTTWYANIGAINMAKTDLVNWPTGKWNEHSNLSVYDRAENAIIKSLSFNEGDFTANYRLGLIWMERQNFHQAIQYLENAYSTNPKHRGIQKNLGYCYTWLGKFTEAELILKEIPESQSEMEVYAWWWKNQGSNDLAKNASKMVLLLGTQ